MIKYADVIVDLQAGDTGKGKVCHHLTQIPNEYTHVIRYNGGGNAGHTIYKDGKKIKQEFAEGKSSEISTSTIIIDEGGKFNQESASSAIKKTTINLIEKLL